MSNEVLQRRAILDEIQAGLQDASISMGQAVRRLRHEVTGLKQEQFAAMCKISLRTLRQLELDEGNPTVQTLNGVFRPFGMRVGIVPVRK
jgi:DNA-binding transcriptional regulator YiaG